MTEIGGVEFTTHNPRPVDRIGTGPLELAGEIAGLLVPGEAVTVVEASWAKRMGRDPEGVLLSAGPGVPFAIYGYWIRSGAEWRLTVEHELPFEGRWVAFPVDVGSLVDPATGHPLSPAEAVARLRALDEQGV